jgi:hypothetical protein
MKIIEIKLKTLAFLEIITLILVTLSIVGIVTINNRIGYGDSEINNAVRYSHLNMISDAVDRYRNLEIESEATLSRIITSSFCGVNSISTSVLSDILVPKYIAEVPTEGPSKDEYFISLDPKTGLISTCAPGSQEVNGVVIPIYITR